MWLLLYLLKEEKPARAPPLLPQDGSSEPKGQSQILSPSVLPDSQFGVCLSRSLVLSEQGG